MTAQNTHKGQYPYWRKKKKKKAHFHIAVELPEIQLMPGDDLVAEGKVENTTRLIQLVNGNIVKLYPTLLFNPLMDPESRFKVASRILGTSNKNISLRRKHDLLNSSLEIHYYRDENKRKLVEAVKNLTIELKKSVESAALKRIREIESNRDIKYIRNSEIRESLNLILRMRSFETQLAVGKLSPLFWELAEMIIASDSVAEGSVSYKHTNDVTHAKLSAIWNIKNIDSLATSDKFNSKSHPLIVAKLYLVRIILRNSPGAFNVFVEHLLKLTNNYSEFQRDSREKELEIQRQSEIRRIRLLEIQRERDEEIARRAINRSEIERVRRETVEKYNRDVAAGLIKPVTGGSSGGGNPWGDANNSRYRKGG